MKSFIFVATCMLTLALALPCSAVVISLGGVQQTDPLSPTIATNSVVLTFDEIAAGHVEVTIDANADAIKVGEILFNVDRPVTFGAATGVVPLSTMFLSNGFGLGGFLTGFDVDVEYALSGPNGVFFSGKQTKFGMFAAGLTAQSFNIPTAGGFFSAAHINLPLGLSPSGKYAGVLVPEPSSLLLLTLGAIASWLGIRARRTA
jgi:hypothetical protein